jgi:uncharacterized membrane protein YhaH (DUF805 family)
MYLIRVIFSFRGRIGRRDYWLIGFPAWVISLALFALAANTVGDDAIGAASVIATFALAVWVVSAIVSKRFRDSGVSGWWAFAMLVPLIGLFVPIIAGATATDSGEAAETAYPPP